MSKDECLFCSIVKGAEEAKVVLDLEEFLVIENKFPTAPVHLLVLDKKHREKFDTMSGDLNVDGYWSRVFKAVGSALALVGLDKSGEYELVCNGPSYAHFQHQHVHILGKYEDGAGSRT